MVAVRSGLAPLRRPPRPDQSAAVDHHLEYDVLVVGQCRLFGGESAVAIPATAAQPPRITRFLDDQLWSEVKTTIDTMPRETDREREHYFRVRWLFSLLYLCGLRISEVIGNTMGGFFVRRDSEGEERWWLEITGKGDKTRLVPATAELMVELARYRRETGCRPSLFLASPLPPPADRRKNNSR